MVSKATAKLSVLEQVDLLIQLYLSSTGPGLVLTRSDQLFRWRWRSNWREVVSHDVSLLSSRA
eukprot:842248-Rhodomonas_salina.1